MRSLFIAFLITMPRIAAAGYLSEAATAGRLEDAKELLSKGADPNEKDSYEQTPLTNAAARNQIDVMKLLLDHGADVNHGTDRGTTALMFAASNGNVEAAKLLIQRGAELEAADKEGRTPIFFANVPAMLKFLSEKGADLNHIDNQGRAPISYAAREGSPEVLTILAEMGADINNHASSGDYEGVTPICFSAGKGNIAIVKMLIDKGADINGLAGHGCVPLQYAAGYGNLEMVKVLIDAGARVEQEDGRGRTALMSAREPSIAKYLIEHGADVDAKSKSGWSAIMGARNPATIKLFLEHGADINAKDDEGNTGLLRSSFDGSTAAVKLLLEYGANPDDVGETGWSPIDDHEYYVNENHNGRWTPLMYAAKANDAEMAQALIDYGADASLKTEDGHTALEIAELKKSEKVIPLLKDWKRKPRPAVKKIAAADKTSSEIKSDVDEPAYKSAEDPSKFALVIGVEKYANLPEARYAARDAASVRSHFLALGVPERQLLYMIGQDASRAGFVKNIEAWLAKRVKSDSTVFVYYSGHGAPDVKTGLAYLVPYDGDATFLQETAYPVKRLYEKLGALKAKRVVVVLDACFSGAGGRSVLAAGTRPLVTKIDTGMPDLKKIAVLAAASGEEITGAEESQGHGLFTYNLLKGLNGAAAADGHVTLQGLYDYAVPKVEDGARRQNRDQTPVLHGSSEDKAFRLR